MKKILLILLVIFLVGCAGPYADLKDQIYRCNERYDSRNLLDITHCYDLNGTQVLYFYTSQFGNYSDPEGITTLEELGYSEEEIQELMEREFSVDVNLDDEEIDESVRLLANVENLEVTRYTKDNYSFRYEAPGFTYSRNYRYAPGGNYDSYRLIINTKMYEIEDCPFLECEYYQYGDYSRGLIINRTGERLKIYAKIGYGGQYTYYEDFSEDELKQLRDVFTGCGQYKQNMDTRKIEKIN